MQKNFINVTPDSGGNGTVTVTASQNTEDERTESNYESYCRKPGT